MGRLALCAGWLVLLSCPVVSAALTPAPEPGSALRALLAAAGVEDAARIAVAPATHPFSREHVAEYDARVVFECLANPRGHGSSAILAVAQLQACRDCAAPGQSCRFLCREIVSGQTLPTPVSHGFCN